MALLSTTVAAESHFPDSRFYLKLNPDHTRFMWARTYLPHLIHGLLLIISLVTGLLYYVHIRRKVTDDSEDISAPASPSTPMRPEANEKLMVANERLYPELPSAPEPPYNPYFQAEAGDGAQELEIIGNTVCDNSGCVTCAKMVTGPVFRSTVTGREHGVSGDIVVILKQI